MSFSRAVMVICCAVGLTAVWGTVYAGAAAAAAADWPDAFEQNKRLGRGVNIIGYDPLWRDRSKARFKQEYFKLIREAGFNHVRINLHPFRDAKMDPQGNLSAEYLKTLDWAVEQALANKLLVVLDFHEFQAMARQPMSHKQRMLAFWKQIAERYKDAPPQVLFELLNEPNSELTPELWNDLLRETLALVRQTNPRRTVIIGPGQWNNINMLEKLKLPDDDRNIIVTIHYYSPFDFTHQGAAWAGRKDKVGIPWHGTDSEKQAILRDFHKAQAWAEKHRRPVYLGEFGVYDRAEMDSRVRWLSFVTREAEKLGWSWAYWQFDGDFIVYDIPKNRWVEPILKALIPPTTKQP